MLDVNPGREAAYPVADALARLGVAFVLVTGYDRDAIPERDQNVMTLQKPMGSQAVVDAVHRWLA